MTTTPLSDASAAPAADAAPQLQRVFLPRNPVLGWSSFAGARDAAVPCVAHLAHTRLVTSGRAALHGALMQLRLPPGSRVLLPSYHCPTMVAPVVRAGLTPCFYAIDASGLPCIGSLDAQGPAGALVAAHLFGLPQDLAAVRAWCDRRGVPLVEDCAHSYFGLAGSQPVGTWGDFAIASVTKFLPVSELGLLGSNRHALRPVALAPQGPRAQVKAWVDVLEVAARHGRPAGLAGWLRLGLALKNTRHARATDQRDVESPDDDASPMTACDLSRVDHAPVHLSVWLARRLPLRRVVLRRQQNFDRLFAALADLPGCHVPPLRRQATHAPYVLPLWVDDAERVYPRLRAMGLPVLRWDRAWPGSDAGEHDTAAGWRTKLLQLPCHQDLAPSELDHLVLQFRRCLTA